MNGIISMVDLLIQTELEEDQRKMMRTVKESAYGLLAIINDILDFSKMEAGKLKLDELISRRFPLEEVNSAFDVLAKGEVARSVLSFE